MAGSCRYSGNWVEFAALSEIVESAATVDLDQVRQWVATWQDHAGVKRATGHAAPGDGLRYRAVEVSASTSAR
jgi:indolepyruvate ferredoxin oxidoreductase